jgi:hypothetical protein
MTAVPCRVWNRFLEARHFQDLEVEPPLHCQLHCFCTGSEVSAAVVLITVLAAVVVEMVEAVGQRGL